MKENMQTKQGNLTSGKTKNQEIKKYKRQPVFKTLYQQKGSIIY